MTVRTRGFGGGGGGDGFTQTVADGLYIPKSLLTTQGDLIYASAANTPARLPAGTAGQILRMNSGATAPEWVSGGMHLIASSTLGSSASSIDFSSIPSTFTHLRVAVAARSDRAGYDVDTLKCTVNNDTTDANYQSRRSFSSGSVGAEWSADRICAYITGATADSGCFGLVTLDIPHYANTGFQRLLTGNGYRPSVSTAQLWFASGLRWMSTSAINRLTFTPAAGSNLISGSTIYLYGIG